MEISKKIIGLSNPFLLIDNHHEPEQKSLRRPLSFNKKFKQTFSHNIKQLKNSFPMKSIKILLCLIVFNATLHAQAWVPRTPFPNARYAAVAFTIGTTSYVGTGSGYLDFYKFDPLANSGSGAWTLIVPTSPFLGASENNVAFVINGKAYVGMGGNGNLLYEFDPLANMGAGTWTQKASVPGVSSNVGVAFAINGKGYFRSGDEPSMANNTSFYEYDPTGNSGMGTWIAKADLGIVLRSAAAFAIGDKGYIGLGLTPSSVTTKVFYEYDPTGNSGMGTWTAKAPFGGSGRYVAVSFSTSTKGYIGLGSDAGGTGQEFWVYTPSSGNPGSWANLVMNPFPNFPGPSRAQAVGFAINDRLFVGLGNTGTLQSSFYEFDPSAVLSVQLTQFSAVMNKSKAQIALNWTTSTERDNAYFAVERKGSLEDDFQEIGRIKGTGNSTQNVQYRLLDNQPLQGIAYYRLRTVDYQESVTYSQTVSVTYEKGGKIVVFPSNTEGPITIDVGTRRIDEANVFSTTGQLLLRGNQNQNQIDLSNLPRGLYFIQVKTANEIAIQKVFKQ
jgi:N-acetylneuraminic acid mutarotase